MTERSAHLAEVAEHQATGRIKDIYDDIRRSTGAPMVNLVYRHMATNPPQLEWAWGVLGPIFASGRLAGAAAALTAQHAAIEGDVIPREVLRAIGVDETAQREIRRIIEAYNSANPMNLLALKMLARMLADPGSGDAHASVSTPRGPAGHAAPPALPPPVDVDSAEPATADLMRHLAGISEGGDGRIIPTLYRHLAHWPGFLALTAVLLGPLFRTDALDTASQGMAADADHTATSLLALAANPPPLSDLEATTLRRFIEGFPPTIARMIIVGGYLQRSLPP